jgi:hypothetical protein
MEKIEEKRTGIWADIDDEKLLADFKIKLITEGKTIKEKVNEWVLKYVRGISKNEGK